MDKMPIPQLDELNLLHANICQALGDPKRILILYALHDRPRHVSALADDLGLPQPTVSRHLRVLRQRRLVTCHRDGPAMIYNVAEPQMIEVLNAMRQIMRRALARQTDALA